MGKCNFCGESIYAPIYRSSECPKCGKGTKICLNCNFYSKNSHWECRESIREVVLDKENSNYCDYFTLSEIIKEKETNKNEAMESFNKLFGD